MNERIKEVADFVGITENNLSDGDMSYKDLEKFAALIIKDCVECCVLVAQASIDARGKIDTRGKELDADFSYWHGREDAAALCRSAIRKHFGVEK